MISLPMIDNSVVYNKFTFNLKDDSVDYTMEFQEDHTDKVIQHFYQFMLGCGHNEGAVAAAMRETSDEWFDSQQSLIREVTDLVTD